MKHKRINIEQQFDNIDIDKVWDFAFHEENSFCAADDFLLFR